MHGYNYYHRLERYLISKLTYQNDSRSPDNGILNVVGVKVEDPAKDHEEDPIDHKGHRQELTSESRVKDAFSAQEVFV